MTDMIAHQGLGSVYTGAEYILAVLKEKDRLSYSRRGEPGDNAVNKSFFLRLKENGGMFSLKHKVLMNYKRW